VGQGNDPNKGIFLFNRKRDLPLKRSQQRGGLARGGARALTKGRGKGEKFNHRGQTSTGLQKKCLEKAGPTCKKRD